jgi:hypothetical protein
VGRDTYSPAEHLALVERMPLVEGPSVRRLMSEPSKGLEPFRRPMVGLGERSKAVSETLRTVARAWSSDKGQALEGDRDGAGSTPHRAGRAVRAGARGSWRPLDWVWRPRLSGGSQERLKGVPGAPQGLLATGMGEGAGRRSRCNGKMRTEQTFP